MGAGVATNPHCLKVPSPRLGRARLQLERVRMFRSRLLLILFGFSARVAPGEEPASRRSRQSRLRLNFRRTRSRVAPARSRSGILFEVASGQSSLSRLLAWVAPSRPSGGTRPGFPSLAPAGISRGRLRYCPISECPFRSFLLCWPSRALGKVALPPVPFGSLPKSPSVSARFRAVHRVAPDPDPEGPDRRRNPDRYQLRSAFPPRGAPALPGSVRTASNWARAYPRHRRSKLFRRPAGGPRMPDLSVPPPQTAPADGFAETCLRFREDRFGHEVKLSWNPESQKRNPPVDNEDNGYNFPPAQRSRRQRFTPQPACQSPLRHRPILGRCAGRIRRTAGR